MKRKLNKNGRDLVRSIVLLIVMVVWSGLADLGFLGQILGLVIGFSTIIWYINKSEVVIPKFMESFENDDEEY